MSNISTILKPSVAGRFYPANPIELQGEINSYLNSADIEPSQNDILGILAPHAGYPFSGPVAAYSYKYALQQNPDTVLFLALSHKGVEGGCVFDYEGFETPLGNIMADDVVTQALLDSGEPFYAGDSPYHGEHSVETNLPFVQMLYPQAKVVSVLISRTDATLCTSMGKKIAGIIKAHPSKKMLIVVSSDMSHFPDYKTAKQLDTEMLKALETLNTNTALQTLKRLEQTDAPNLHCVMCGSAAMLTLLATAETLIGYQGRFLHYRSSGDSPYGDHEKVVGYGAFAVERSQDS